MRKYFLIVVAIVATLFVSCERVDDNAPVEEVKMQRFVATLGSPKGGLRVAITPDANNQVWSYKWEDGDKIYGVPMSSLSPSTDEILSLNDKTKLIPCTVSVDESGVATFECDAPVGYMAMAMLADGDVYEQVLTPDKLMESYADRHLFMVSDLFEVIEGVAVVSRPIVMHHGYAVVDLNVIQTAQSPINVKSITVHGVSNENVENVWQSVHFEADGTVNFWKVPVTDFEEHESVDITFDAGQSLVINSNERVSIPFCISPSWVQGSIIIVYVLEDDREITTAIKINGSHEIKHGLHYTFNSTITSGSFVNVGTHGYKLSDFVPSADGAPFNPSGNWWYIHGTGTSVIGNNYSELYELGRSIDAAVGNNRSVGLEFPTTEYFARSYSHLLKNINILKIPRVSHIDFGALRGYENLTTLTINRLYYSCQNRVLYNADKTLLHTYFNSQIYLKKYISPESVVEIGDYAFASGKVAETMVFPNVEVVGSKVFMDDSAVKSVSLPSATTLGQSVFSSTDALESIELATASGVKINVASGAFEGCATEKIVLTIGAANAEFVNGDELTLSDGAKVKFQQIKVLAQ